MNVEQSTIDIIVGFEGFEAKAYRDDGGVWTIGYGFTKVNGAPVTQNTPDMTVENANNIIGEILSGTYAAEVNQAIKVALTRNQFDACVSLCYNIGTAGFASSTVAKQCNLGNFQRAANAFLLWNKVNGHVDQTLVNRRQKEKALFLS